jgi:hypothetical protein
VQQVRYFCEGETERNLLKILKERKKIQLGVIKIHNLWEKRFKNIIRKINTTDKLLFVVDTDRINNKSIFLENIKLLQSYNICLIVQDKDLEDELCFACGKVKKPFLFKSFYNVQSKKEFKSRFNKDGNLQRTLSKNNFDVNMLWVSNNNFSNWLKNNHIEIDICIGYKRDCVNP